MTEVILDTEVMPREPHDCLPAHMTVVPALLNGRCQDAMARLGPRAVAAAAASRPFGVMPLTGSWVTGLDAQLVGGRGCLWHRGTPVLSPAPVRSGMSCIPCLTRCSRRRWSRVAVMC